MALNPGARLSTHEILGPLGAGGMGEVYRARDTKLGREVAIKVLPEGFSRDSERLARFEREARLLASLNHANIATLHGLEDSDGTLFLVMELVPGETLAEHIAKGPISIDEALPLFAQIAEGLEAAHEKGVIHRDLKPANIKVTPDKKPKILDFGLAKAYEEDAPASNLSESPTFTRGTATGVILGTAPYMSPEQARGRNTDKKADIWAFGCCFYEALTGKAAFLGETVSDTIAGILEREPDWHALPSTTPAPIRSLLRRCLRKDTANRLHDIADARIEVEETLAGPTFPEPVAASREKRTAPWIPLALAVLVAGVAGWHLGSSRTPRFVTQLRMGLAPAEILGTSITLGNISSATPRLSRTALAFSPDGGLLVYVGGNRITSQLYLRPLDRPEASPIPGTEGGLGPFFSPDGEWVGFWAEGELKKVSIRGGPPLSLCETPPHFGASWGTDDRIVFAGQSGGLLRVSANGGTPEAITALDADNGELSHRLPYILPGGDAVLFTVRKQLIGGWERSAQIAVQSLVTGERKVLVENGADARYVPTGHLLYVRLGTLMAAHFDPASLEISDGSVPLIAGIRQAAYEPSFSMDTGAAQFSFSGSGSLVYVPGGVRSGVETSLVWVDRQGLAESLDAPSRAYFYPRISPDGQRVAVNVYEEGNDDLWVHDLPRGTWTRFTSHESAEDVNVWTPDGTRIMFRSDRAGPSNIYSKPADGSKTAERLTTMDSIPVSSTPDGKAVAFLHDRDIWVLPSEGESRPFIESPFWKLWPAFSPDGQWIAYGSNETGRHEVYVEPYPGPGGKVQISTEGGKEPAWSPGGRELFYRAPLDDGGKRWMMVVDINKELGSSAGRPRVLFLDEYATTGWARDYDLTPDGERFLMVRDDTPPEEDVTELRVVLNWFEELRRAVP